MSVAAREGYVDIVKLCKEWGAKFYNGALYIAAKSGYLEFIKLCKEWGAKDYVSTMEVAAKNGHIKIVKLCKEWLYEAHDEVYQYHHKSLSLKKK